MRLATNFTRPALGTASILILILILTVPGILAAQNPANLPASVGPTLTAKPFTVAEKFDYNVVQTFGLRGFGAAAIGAAIAQAADVPHDWGQGFEGYATRYGSSFGTNLSRQTMALGLEMALHEDPRYFPSTEKGLAARMKNILLQTVVTRTDSGKQRFAVSRMASAFGAGQLTNTWQPASNNTVGDGLIRTALTLAGDAGYNFLQEFFPFLRPHSLRH
jgi:hypothetical protein